VLADESSEDPKAETVDSSAVVESGVVSVTGGSGIAGIVAFEVEFDSASSVVVPGGSGIAGTPPPSAEFVPGGSGIAGTPPSSVVFVVPGGSGIAGTLELLLFVPGGSGIAGPGLDPGGSGMSGGPLEVVESSTTTS
jgi:hypothetical protein